MTDKKINDASDEQDEQTERRKLLKTLGAGGSGILVTRWVAPIVTAVTIPAHAQTSFAQALIAVGP